MFDYIYSNKKNILKNPEKFIIFVKRLLPKYANSLPDSAAISLYREVKKLKGENNLIIETGVGASTIVLFVASYIYKKKLFYVITNGLEKWSRCIFGRSNRFQRLRHGKLLGYNYQFFDDRLIRSKVTTFFGLATENFPKKYQKKSVTIFIENHMKIEIFNRKNMKIFDQKFQFSYDFQ